MIKNCKHEKWIPSAWIEQTWNMPDPLSTNIRGRIPMSAFVISTMMCLNCGIEMGITAWRDRENILTNKEFKEE